MLFMTDALFLSVVVQDTVESRNSFQKLGVGIGNYESGLHHIDADMLREPRTHASFKAVAKKFHLSN
jgi:hypothetical protein